MMIWSKAGAIVLISGFFLASCQPAASNESSTAIPTIAPTLHSPTPTSQLSTPTPAQEMESEPVVVSEPTDTATPVMEMEETFTHEISEVVISVDGLDLAGTFYAPKNQPPPWPGVILLHMLWGSRTSWDEYAEEFAKAGFAVLSIDLRGHGETGGAVDWESAVSDLQQVWSYFTERPDIDPDRTAFVGASIGANLALIAGANEPAVRTVVLLSPGLNYAGVKTEAAMQSFGERPVLIAASQEDTYAASSSIALDAKALGESQLIMYEDAGHGTFIFQAEPELSQLIIEWLDRYLN
jgi:dienelactone hydrolase